MFTKSNLLNNANLMHIISNKLSIDKPSIGRFNNIKTVDEFIDKLTKADIDKVYHLPKIDGSIYTVRNLDTGYSEYISPYRLLELINLNLIDKNICIHFKYKLYICNIITYINESDIKMDLLHSDIVYIFTLNKEKLIFNVTIGKPTNPNFFYYRNDLDNLVVLPKESVKIRHLNRIDIERKPSNEHFLDF